MDKMQPKKRGRPATGKGIPVQVRLQEDLFDALDEFARDAGKTRPQVIKQIFTIWAESADLIDRDQDSAMPVLVMLPRNVYEAFRRARKECFPQTSDKGDAIAIIVAKWLEERQYLPG